MSARTSDPRPGNRQGPVAIGYSDDEQLVACAHLAPINDQAYQAVNGCFRQQGLGDGPIPDPHTKGTVLQEATQPLHRGA